MLVWFGPFLMVVRLQRQHWGSGDGGLVEEYAAAPPGTSNYPRAPPHSNGGSNVEILVAVLFGLLSLFI
jgi:hypothetical protein